MAYGKTLVGLGLSLSSTLWAQAPSPAIAASASLSNPAPLSAASAAVAVASAASATTRSNADKANSSLGDAYTSAQSWRYKVTGYYLGPLSASAEMQFARTGRQSYQADLAVTVAGQNALSMQSTGAIAGTKLIPRNFNEQVMGKAYKVKTEDGNIVFRGDVRYPVPKQGVQDSISQYYQLQQRLLSGELASTAGASTVVWLMRPEGLFAWNYQVSDTKTIHHPILGAVETVHIVPRSLGKGTTKSEFWFAPKLSYAPVRIKMALDNKSWMEMNWLP